MKKYLYQWFDSYSSTDLDLQNKELSLVAGKEFLSEQDNEKVDWLRILPFIALHLICLLAIWVKPSPFAIGFAVVFYFLRMFAITGFYHRYFSHKSFKTSRLIQFIFAVIGASTTQKGALWWSAHHRHHHKHSDTDNDVHASSKSFFWSHMGWFLSKKNLRTRHELVKDWAKFPELVWLDRHAMLVPLLMIVLIWCLGEWLASAYPALQTNGLQLLIWGFFISTVCLTHATLCINSLAHRFGKQTYKTGDESRNNFFLAMITLGEGWHNNHHFSPGCVRQGFRWWQIDITYYVLTIMSWFGLVWDLKPVPQKVFDDKHQW